MTKNFITVEQKEVFNLHGDVYSDLRLTIDINTIQSGIINKLGIYNFSVLVCLASHMNSEGNCFPSQKKISELTGISINKVTSCVKELLETEIDGEPIFTRSFAKGKKGKRTVYQFQGGRVDMDKLAEAEAKESAKDDLLGDLVAEAEGKVNEPAPKEEKPVDQKPMNAKDVVVLFAETYRNTFNDGYIVSWGKEMKLVKEKLLPNFSSEDIRSMIKVAVEQYSGKWANDRYPRPTLSMICGWLGKEAFKIVLAEKNQERSMQIRIDSAEQSETEMDKFLAM